MLCGVYRGRVGGGRTASAALSPRPMLIPSARRTECLLVVSETPYNMLCRLVVFELAAFDVLAEISTLALLRRAIFGVPNRVPGDCTYGVRMEYSHRGLV